jgi:hypothetical protein
LAAGALCAPAIFFFWYYFLGCKTTGGLFVKVEDLPEVIRDELLILFLGLVRAEKPDWNFYPRDGKIFLELVHRRSFFERLFQKRGDVEEFPIAEFLYVSAGSQHIGGQPSLEHLLYISLYNFGLDGLLAEFEERAQQIFKKNLLGPLCIVIRPFYFGCLGAGKPFSIFSSKK